MIFIGIVHPQHLLKKFNDQFQNEKNLDEKFYHQKMMLKFVQFVLKNGQILVNIDLLQLNVVIFLEKCSLNLIKD